MTTSESAAARDRQPPVTPCDLMVVHGRLVTIDPSRPVIEDGALTVTDGRIAAVGSTSAVGEAYAPARILNARGGLVHPGFVDPHYHTTFHTGRGFLASASAPPEAEKVFDLWENELTGSDEYDSALAAFMEALRSGYTAVQDAGTAYEPDAVAAAAEAAGIRCFLADPYLWDMTGEHPPSNRASVDLKRCEEQLGGQLWRNRDGDGLVRGYVAIYGVGTASDELIVAAKACAREHGVVFASHQSFAGEDRDLDAKRFGRPPVEHLAELGVLDDATVLTHMNILDESEVDLLLRAETNVAWNPTNYFFYGICNEAKSRVLELLERGGHVALCNDIAKAWAFTDEQLVAYFAARSAGIDLSARMLFEVLTLGGARAVGMGGELGRLSEGRRADFVVHRGDHPLLETGTTPELHVLLVSRAASVDTVVVAGKVVVEGGHCVLVDEDAASSRARASARRVATRVETEMSRGRLGE